MMIVPVARPSEDAPFADDEMAPEGGEINIETER
jgi:hypothetical protein